MKLLYSYVLLSVVQIEGQVLPSEDVRVKGLERREYQVLLNEYNCVIEEVPSNGLRCNNLHFTTTDIVIDPYACRDTSLIVNIPNCMYHNWRSDFINTEANFKSRLCSIQDGRCRIFIDFQISEPPRTTQDNEAATQNGDKTNPNLYIYVGVGGALVLLIVLVQTGCIVLYSREVVDTRRAIENVLHRQGESREANDRYSHGPVLMKLRPKATTTTTAVKQEDDDVYESLEQLDLTASKDGDTIKSYNVKDRPPLPLPHEKPSSEQKDDGKKVESKHVQGRPPLPLPGAVSTPRYNVKTLPHNISKKASSDTILKPLLNGTVTTPRFRPKLPQSFPVNTLPDKIKSKPERSAPELPVTSNMSPLKVPPNVPPKKKTAGFVVDELKNVILKNPNPGSNSSSSSSTTAIPRPKPSQYVPLQTNIKINERGDSSDEEWTYEKLPPVTRYLR